MGGANIVLGVQWLKTLGDIVINHKKLTMAFNLGDTRVIWQGDESLGRTHLLEGSLKRLMGKGDVAFLCQLHGGKMTSPQVELRQWEQLEQVLQKYKSVGEEPSGLPLLQTTDHHILLNTDAVLL